MRFVLILTARRNKAAEHFGWAFSTLVLVIVGY